MLNNWKPMNNTSHGDLDFFYKFHCTGSFYPGFQGQTPFSGEVVHLQGVKKNSAHLSTLGDWQDSMVLAPDLELPWLTYLGGSVCGGLLLCPKENPGAWSLMLAPHPDSPKQRRSCCLSSQPHPSAWWKWQTGLWFHNETFPKGPASHCKFWLCLRNRHKCPPFPGDLILLAFELTSLIPKP